MIAVFFRVIVDGEPTGYYGLAFAQNKKNLFWAIDEYADPYSVEVRTASGGGFCRLRTIDTHDDVEQSKWEVSEEDCRPEDEKWKSPNWGNYVYGEKNE